MSSSAVTDALRSHILSLSTALDPSDPPPPDIMEKETINRASVISLTKIAAKKSSVASLPVPSTSSKTIVASSSSVAAAMIKPLLSRTSSHSTIKHFKRPSTSNNETSAAISSPARGSGAGVSSMTSGGGLVVMAAGKPTPASDKSSTYSFDTAKESLEPGYYTAMSETSSPRTSKELKRGISCESCRIFFENHGRLPLRPKHVSSPSSASSFPELAPPPVAVTPPHSPKSKRGKAPSSLHSVHSIQEQPVASTSSYQTRQQPQQHQPQLQKNRDFTRIINNNNNVEDDDDGGDDDDDDDGIEKDQRIPARDHLLKCGLCQESVHRRGLPCGHVYCRDCLIKLAEDADGRSEAMAQWLEEKKRFWNPPIPPTVPMYGPGGPVPWGYPVMPGGVPQMERSRTAPFSYDTSFASNNNDRHSRAYTMEMYERERGFERGMTPIYPSMRRPPLSTSAREVEDDGVPSTKPVVAPPDKRRLLIRGLLFLSALGGISVCIKAYTVTFSSFYPLLFTKVALIVAVAVVDDGIAG